MRRLAIALIIILTVPVMAATVSVVTNEVVHALEHLVFRSRGFSGMIMGVGVPGNEVVDFEYQKFVPEADHGTETNLAACKIKLNTVCIGSGNGVGLVGTARLLKFPRAKACVIKCNLNDAVAFIALIGATD